MGHALININMNAGKFNAGWSWLVASLPQVGFVAAHGSHQVSLSGIILITTANTNPVALLTLEQFVSTADFAAVFVSIIIEVTLGEGDTLHIGTVLIVIDTFVKNR
jgi:hypothetical protein